MSIIPDVNRHDLTLLAELAVGGRIDIRSARMEPSKRYRIDVRDPELTTIYMNRHDHAPADLAAGLIRALERVRQYREEQRRAGLRVIQGGAQ
ncbi:hypothetical protein ACFPK1_18830 [Actinomycetospora rhizophila]|uniref:Uncharacterized protein n=1 Tax=Actinomycetospora rhizophila TaxID=1416876 RepID=A0ABV9ZGL4_9PSEU